MLSNRGPLADQMRPESFNEFLGQEEILGKGALLKKAIESDKVPSIIFWGPPGSGKTTLAFIIAKKTKSAFQQISAVSSGKKDLITIINIAGQNKRLGQKTILFIDEIHRWNKAQQDALLPYVEKGLITLIGATTENPSFEIRPALLSRCRVFVLKRLSLKNLEKILAKAIRKLEIKLSKSLISLIAGLSNGDARTALNALEYLVSASKGAVINKAVIKQAFQKSHLFYDKNGEEHYNIISALHKSMRVSDADAALYWLSRMLEAGEDPLYIARRIIRFASEDIGIANSRALEQAVAAYQACYFIGMPECSLALAQAVVYMAKCTKSRELDEAYAESKEDVLKYGNLDVPLSIRNAPTKLMRELGYGSGKQKFMPEKLKNKKYLK
ncbi:MAG: replication-associated recombination protein A [bacterium]